MKTNILDQYGRRFGQQKPRDQRPVEVTPNPVADEICRRYEQWLDENEYEGGEKAYSLSIEKLTGLAYTSKDVSDFSIALSKYQKEEHFNLTGFFLSGLVELCPEQDFDIITEHLEKSIFSIGYKNRKNIIVRGDVGTGIGYRMENGTMVIQGSVEGFIGDSTNFVGKEMENGTIIIQGNVEECFIGPSMKGGSIIIHGNAEDEKENRQITDEDNVGNYVGDEMENGLISIDNGVFTISHRWKGGKIYHRGVLVRGVEE